MKESSRLSRANRFSGMKGTRGLRRAARGIAGRATGRGQRPGAYSKQAQGQPPRSKANQPPTNRFPQSATPRTAANQAARASCPTARWKACQTRSTSWWRRSWAGGWWRPGLCSDSARGWAISSSGGLAMALAIPWSWSGPMALSMFSAGSRGSLGSTRMATLTPAGSTGTIRFHPSCSASGQGACSRFARRRWSSRS